MYNTPKTMKNQYTDYIKNLKQFIRIKQATKHKLGKRHKQAFVLMRKQDQHINTWEDSYPHL